MRMGMGMRRRKKDATFGTLLTVAVLIAGGIYFGRQLKGDTPGAGDNFAEAAHTVHTESLTDPIPVFPIDTDFEQAASMEESDPAQTTALWTVDGRGPEIAFTPAADSAPVPVRKHRIRKNEMLSTIAKTYYDNGTEKYWRHILKHNPGLNPKNLRLGTEIVIPPAPAKAHTAGAGTKRQAATNGVRTHTIRKNEKLWTIAEHYYGKGILYTKIERANPGVDPDNLKLGARLIIPAP